VRGHALVWGKFPGSGFPMDMAEILNQASNPRAELQKILEEHVFTVAGRYVGRISAWDVVNEPFELFRNRLDKNVFYHENLNLYAETRVEALLKLVRNLKEKSTPIDGVGLQSHVCIELPSLKELKNYFRQLADLGLEIEITEMDASLSLFRSAKDPYKTQGDFFKAFTETCLECSACKGITFWGINDKNNWMDHLLPPLIPFKPNNPLLYDDEMRPKPAHDGVLNALI
jgi:endo-1,4-beta-xylanase